MKNWDHSIHQHVLVYKGKELELFCFICVEVIKKFMGSVFFGGHPVYIYLVRIIGKSTFYLILSLPYK